MCTRHITPSFISGWQITNAQGEHTAHVDGDRQDALDCAYQQLASGNGQVTIEDHDA